MEKSQLNNPLCPDSKKPKPGEPQKPKFQDKKKRLRSDNVPTFAGMESHPGHTKLPSKRKIFSQSEVHKETLKDVKKRNKQNKHTQEIRKEKKRDPKVNYYV